MMTRWLLALVFAAMPAFGADKPTDFMALQSLALTPGEPFYRIELPPALYETAQRPDFGDVRVFNGAGEVVPHAFLPRPTSARTPGAQVELSRYPLRGDPARGVEGVNLRIDTVGGRTSINVTTGERASEAPKLLGYVLDASAIDASLAGLTFALGRSDPSLVTRLSIDASDDLRNWRGVAADVAIVRLEASGNQLLRNQATFAATRAKYWRIVWHGPAVEIERVTADTSDVYTELERRYRDIEGRALDKPGEYEFDARGRFPIDRLRLRLPEQNTVVGVQILVRGQATEPWRFVTSATVYRLLRGGQEITSPDIALPPTTERYWLVRADQRGGGIGTGVPGLTQGWLPHELVFAARGTGPFQLGYGSRAAAPSALAIDALVPGWRPTASFPSALPEAALPEQAVRPAPRAAPAEMKNWILWSILLAAVALLGWMASRVMRKL